MRVLVTGATGFVGSYTSTALLDAGHDVRVLVRDPEKLSRTPTLRGRTELDIVQGDVTDASTAERAAKGCQAVVHSAALVALDTRRADDARRVNVDGTKHVITAGLNAGVTRVVYVSTVALFGVGLGRRVDVDSPLVEGTGPYARSKYDAEAWIREQQSQGAPITCTYPAGVYGPDAPEMSPQLEGMVFWVKYPPRMPGGTSVVDVRDLAAVHTQLLGDTEAPTRLMLGGTYLPWATVCELIAQVTGRHLFRVPLPGAVLRSAGRVGDFTQRFYPRDSKWTAESMQAATRAPSYDSTPARERYGTDVFRPVSETFADTIAWLARAGHLPRRYAGSLVDG